MRPRSFASDIPIPIRLKMLELYEQHHISQPVLAVRFGVSVDTVKKMLKWARENRAAAA